MAPGHSQYNAVVAGDGRCSSMMTSRTPTAFGQLRVWTAAVYFVGDFRFSPVRKRMSCLVAVWGLPNA